MKMKILFLGLSIMLSSQLYGQIPKGLMTTLKVEAAKQRTPKTVSVESFHIQMKQAKKRRALTEKPSTTINKKERVKVLKNQRVHSKKQGFTTSRYSEQRTWWSKPKKQ